MKLPKVARVKQEFCVPVINDLEVSIENHIIPWVNNNKEKLQGKNIAITAGSRGIDRIPIILRTIAQILKNAGANPFFVPAMGSHGGATEEGQLNVLNSLGLTEESLQAPIKASLDTVQIGVTGDGIPVYVDKFAAEADGIVLVNRIKPHTEFKGIIESGLMKMTTIGLGKYEGATIAHNYALRKGYDKVIINMANVILSKLPVLFGLAVLENCYDKIAHVELIPKEKIYEREVELLLKAQSLMMRLPFRELDVVVIDEMGKNISGTGMDTNVIGRIMVYGQKELGEPDIIRIVVLDLTPEAHGNATGIGLADYATEKLYKKINFESTYINCVTACTPEKARIPIILKNDREAICYALKTIGIEEPHKARLVHIRNTLNLSVIEVSEALIPEVQENNKLHLLEPLRSLIFTDNDDLYPVDLT